jgi:hypothetical protein
MSDQPPMLSDTIGEAMIVTTLAPEGDRWISMVRGGPLDSYASVMDAKGNPAELHASVLQLVKDTP